MTGGETYDMLTQNTVKTYDNITRTHIMIVVRVDIDNQRRLQEDGLQMQFRHFLII